MSTVAVSLLTLVAGAVISGVGTYVVARRTLALDYDSDLRTRRIVAYTDLWSRLEPLAKYAPREFFSQAEARAFAESLRVWYFEQGGLFLSEATRNDYFALQDALARIARGWGWATDEREALTPAARDHLRTCGSRLRTGLTQDVGTRTRPKVRGAVEHLDRSFAGVYERDDGRRLELQVRPRLRRAPHLTLYALEPDGTKRSCLKRWSPARWAIHASIDDPTGKRRERALLVERGQLVEGPALEDDRAPAALWKLLD